MALRLQFSDNVEPQKTANVQRLAALSETGLLEMDTEEAFDRLTRIASFALKTKIAAVSIVGKDKIYLKSIRGVPDHLIPPRTMPLEDSMCLRVVELEKPIVVEDVRLLPETQPNKPRCQALNIVSYLGVPLKLNSGFVLGSFCVFEQHPRKWTPDEISIMEDLAASVMTAVEMRMLSAWKSEILSIVSHDLKNPLSAITLTSQVLMREVKKVEPRLTAETLGPALERIQRTGSYMQLLINNTLDKERLELGPVELDRKWVRISKLVQRSVELVNPLAEEKKIKVKVVANCDSCETFVDETRFVQVLVNLLGNAIKFSPQDSQVELKIILERTLSYFSVSDEGPGIQRGDLRSIFQRFWRGRGKAEGHGLGLHIISKIVKAHGGDILVSNRDGGGAEFKVTLPGVNRGA